MGQKSKRNASNESQRDREPNNFYFIEKVCRVSYCCVTSTCVNSAQRDPDLIETKTTINLFKSRKINTDAMRYGGDSDKNNFIHTQMRQKKRKENFFSSRKSTNETIWNETLMCLIDLCPFLAPPCHFNSFISIEQFYLSSVKFMCCTTCVVIQFCLEGTHFQVFKLLLISIAVQHKINNINALLRISALLHRHHTKSIVRWHKNGINKKTTNGMEMENRRMLLWKRIIKIVMDSRAKMQLRQCFIQDKYCFCIRLFFSASNVRSN